MQISENLWQSAKKLQAWYFRDQMASLGKAYASERPRNPRLLEHLDPTTLHSLLIYKLDEIGDAICAAPALALLRRQLPQTRLVLLCQKKCAPIYERLGLLDEILTVQLRLRWNRFPTFDLREALKGRFFSAALYLRSYPASFKDFLRVPAEIKVHPQDPRMRSASPYQPWIPLWSEPREHQVVQMLEIASPFTRLSPHPSLQIFPEFSWTPDDTRSLSQVFGDAIPEQYFVLHPFSSGETRHYSFDHWEKVAAKIRDSFRRPMVVIGGAGDEGWKKLPDVIDQTGKLSLGQTGYLLSRATAFLGNLSGPAHWAGAMDIPSVVFFGGHSLAEEWAPRASRTLLLFKEMPCAPCHRKTCPGLGVACLNDLKPEEIWPQLSAFLDESIRLKKP